MFVISRLFKPKNDSQKELKTLKIKKRRIEREKNNINREFEKSLKAKQKDLNVELYDYMHSRVQNYFYGH